jgi:Zn-finger nucleic acid-binding protein
MQCPKCGVTMREREVGEVIIDICPQCRGVWLDPGELEKLSVREQRYYGDGDDDDGDYDSDDIERRRTDYDPRREREYERSRVGSDGRPRKKKGFLSSMFESFGEGGGED